MSPIQLDMPQGPVAFQRLVLDIGHPRIWYAVSGL